MIKYKIMELQIIYINENLNRINQKRRIYS